MYSRTSLSSSASRRERSLSWPTTRYRLWLQTSNLPAPPLVDRGLIPHGVLAPNRHEGSSSTETHTRHHSSVSPPQPKGASVSVVSRYSRHTSVAPNTPGRDQSGAGAGMCMVDQLLSLHTAARNLSLARSCGRHTRRTGASRRIYIDPSGDVSPPPGPPTLDTIITVMNCTLNS